jgi:hypothetical protein
VNPDSTFDSKRGVFRNHEKPYPKFERLHCIPKPQQSDAKTRGRGGGGQTGESEKVIRFVGASPPSRLPSGLPPPSFRPSPAHRPWPHPAPPPCPPPELSSTASRCSRPPPRSTSSSRRRRCRPRTTTTTTSPSPRRRSTPRSRAHAARGGGRPGMGSPGPPPQWRRRPAAPDRPSSP